MMYAVGIIDNDDNNSYKEGHYNCPCNAKKYLSYKTTIMKFGVFKDEFQVSHTPMNKILEWLYAEKFRKTTVRKHSLLQCIFIIIVRNSNLRAIASLDDMM